MTIAFICDGAEPTNSIGEEVVIGQVFVAEVAQGLSDLRSELSALPIELKQVTIGVAGNVSHLIRLCLCLEILDERV